MPALVIGSIHILRTKKGDSRTMTLIVLELQVSLLSSPSERGPKGATPMRQIGCVANYHQ